MWLVFVKSLLELQFVAVLLSLGARPLVEVTFLVFHHNPVTYSVSGVCLILPGFGISAVEEPTKCHGKYCLAVEKNSLTLSWNFRQLLNTM